MDYKQYIKTRLESHPLGRTTDKLARKLPADGSDDGLAAALSELEDRGTVKRIGGKWRWMRFE
jgi:hypothetical protein